ncbi:Long-chain-alcohol O-fatty-acyltransferase [Handroanthus impetiginosus]|uniref:Long-chain-alcohol O-fatty-acyltransferase n=1 Tax=Handroanthus impetiginosus TaxID=429701 RepID=A0A2G9G002_9LAMI|nr:Long-chain-alcohol O-fatty-acyltransferase [Handroanthus impetiginosus]
MEEDLSNFIIVWSLILVSTCYCYGISKLAPKGTIRFFMFLPVICLFLLLPLNIKSINLVVPTAFFVTWLTTFKLLLLVFGTGPLSNPSLSLFHFVLISCLPIKLQQQPISPKKSSKKSRNKEDFNPTNNTCKIGLKPFLDLAEKGLILIFLMFLGFHKDKIPRDIVLFLICFYVYIAMELLLGVSAIIGQFLLKTKVDLPFNQPYFSTSLQDFWGYRWNRVSSNILRTVVFDPIKSQTSRVMDQKWAAALALLATFMVSDLMHEIIFYYIGRVRFGWGTTLFFLIQGLCVVIESTIKRKIDAKWQLPQVIMGPLVFGFVICMFMWIALPELLAHKVDDRALEEYVALGGFVRDLGVTWSEIGY